MSTETSNTPDFESMTLEELAAWKHQKKAEYRSGNKAFHAKVLQAHLDEAGKQLGLAAVLSGRTLSEQAWYWLSEENASDDGHRIQAGLYLNSALVEGVTNDSSIRQ